MPGSIFQLAPAYADGWIPATSVGMTGCVRETAFIHAGKTLEAREELREAIELVVDAVHAAGVPVGGDVDADHRLVEPALGLVGELRHRQVGAELDDGLDVGPVDRLDGLD